MLPTIKYRHSNQIVFLIAAVGWLFMDENELGGMNRDSASHTPAHESTATVASFRTWLGLRSIIARGPAESGHYTLIINQDATEFRLN